MRDPAVSFIMPAKNAAAYVSDAISVLLEASFGDWELIVVEDHSSDNTLDVLRSLAERDDRITVVPNVGNGKVAGLNYGYTLARGRFIKCIDADDRLAPEFFEHVGAMERYDAMCHDAWVTTSDLKAIGKYAMDPSVLGKDFAHCLKYLKGLARWTWSFSREIGDRIFPMPTELPFEDVWFSLVIKRYATKISYINEPLYYYRQHGNQTFGGVLAFDEDIVIFRAKRMLNLLRVIEGRHGVCLTEGITSDGFFDEIRLFYTLLAQPSIAWGDILLARMAGSLKMKVITYRKLRRLAPCIVRLKWFVDRLRESAGRQDNC